MKKLIIWAVFGLVILVTIGCFKVDINVSVNPDGSGRIKQTIGLSKETFEMLNGMMTAMPGVKDEKGKKEDETAAMEKEFRKATSSYGDGVYFESFSKETTKDGFICFNVAYTFTDITKIKLNPQSAGPMSSFMGGMSAPSASAMEAFGFVLKKTVDGKATVLTIKSPLKKTAVQESKEKPEPKDPEQVEQPENKEEPGSDSEADMEMAKQFLKGLRISMGLTCGAEIVETNASFRDGNKIIFMEIDGDKLFASMDKWKGAMEKYQKNFTPDNIVNMKGAMEELSKLTGGAFKVELAEEINIKFK
ncbi:MAG: hypothetical protein WC980_07095 [Candidatus Brocadiia bacterium]